MAATALFAAAGLAVAAGVAVALLANEREGRLARSHVQGTDVFDLTRISKPVAVMRSNEVISLWNGAMALGATGLAATGTGAWLFSRGASTSARAGGKARIRRAR